MTNRLRKEQDAFGRAMWDYWRQGKGYEIIERRDGYVDISYGPQQYLAPFAAWPVHQRRAVKYARGRVLDLGCGAGRHALYLQERGHEVVGIDISPLAVKVCRERGLKKVKLLSIDEVGPGLGAFDTITMFCNNFGLFSSPAQARRLLRRFAKLTNPGARIIAESLDYSKAEPDHLANYRQNRVQGRCPGQLRIRIRYKTYCTPWFDYLFVTPGEMGRIVAETGWAIVKLIQGRGTQYIAILEKI